ncbi:uncharacterized protein LTR77_001074 [Saxophila tyrrhenica]|uniref:Defect at low temperature protein 1 n=1 Tax=Saxophila tyrrhenica TaxID=1690608 RepID=A0AAV9PJ85_9PEZI|nr:hypothetical protein LTR77_001074 [Saxophila tyrrhenica]
MSRRRPGHFLPFRIPFFRIFYSTTYTTLYILCLGMLAIPPASMIWSAIQNQAYQYVIMIGGTYILTALIAIFIYASRLYTNRTVLAGVGKAYIPIEDGELGRSVRKMIVKQLERSAIVAWESRPRDLLGEILEAETVGVLPPEAEGLTRNDYTVGREISVDPAHPPWGHVQHAGWSSPSHFEENSTPNLHFAMVIDELPNLIEAKAVALAPAEETAVPANGPPMADPVVADVLRRPETMSMRDYLTQLSYLGLVNPLELGQRFLMQYERARFGSSPVTEQEFHSLMADFSELLSGMAELDAAIIEQIREQAGEKASALDETEDDDASLTATSTLHSPVTARTAPSRSTTPYINQNLESEESVGSVIHQVPPESKDRSPTEAEEASIADSGSILSMETDTGSVLRHRPSSGNG